MALKPSGTGLVLISALAFGTLAVLARGADAAGVGTVTLLFLRFAFAVPLLLIYAAIAHRPPPDRQKLPGLVLLGLLYIGQSFSFFMALQYIPAGLVSLLLYLYPVFVTGASVLLLGERMNRIKWTALAMAVVGSMMTIGPVTGGDPRGLAFGIATAIFYSAYIVVGTRVMAGVDAFTGSLVILTVAALFYGGWGAIEGYEMPTEATGWLYALGLALVPTVIAISTFLAGLERIGPVNASTLSALEPLVTVTLAGLLLAETLLPVQFAGGALILAAVVVLARAGQAQES